MWFRLRTLFLSSGWTDYELDDLIIDSRRWLRDLVFAGNWLRAWSNVCACISGGHVDVEGSE